MNLVFDFGKVVFDWEPRALVAGLLPHHAPDDARAGALEADFFQGFRGDWADFDRGTLPPDVLADRIARRTGITPAEARGVIDAVPGVLTPLPAMQALLRRLSGEGHALFFLSNMPAPYADALDAAHAFLRRPPEGLFQGGVYSARVGVIKPDPAIYALALRRFGIPAAGTLLIDDLQANVDAARAAGWQALRFEDAAQCDAALRRLIATPSAEPGLASRH